MDKLRRALSGHDTPDEQDEERGGIISQVVDTSSLSWETRIKYFAICMVSGFLLTLLGCVLLFLPGGGLVIFAILYTIGNILALSSTFFLMGPAKQCERMFKSTRLIATVIMMGALVMTLVAVFVLGNTLLALLMVLVQFLAMTWYSLSYIPYARDAAKKCFGSCIGT